MQTRHSPIIVGERYELAETLSLGYGGEHPGGLLAKSDCETALLSMSDYEKIGASNVKGYVSRKPSQIYGSLADHNASRCSQDSMYLAYTQPEIAVSQVQPASTAYDRNADQVAFAASSFYQPRANYDVPQPEFADYELRRVPEVKSYNPQHGTKGSHIYVYIRADYDLLAPPALVANLMFAARRVPASLTRLETHGPAFEYVVTSDAPQFSETGSSTQRIQLRLQLEENSGQDAGVVGVGYFEYSAGPIRSSSYEISRKRKLSVGAGDSSAHYGAYSFGSVGGTAYPQSLHSIDLDSMHRRFTPYGRSQNQLLEGSRKGERDLSVDSAASRALMRPPTSQTPLWSPAFSVVNQSSRNPALDITKASSGDFANPPLIRTSTLQQNGVDCTRGTGLSSASFNPYAIYPQKAVLRIRGNLDTMIDGWTSNEWAAKRRLVQFWRSQNKSTITADFAPVAPEDRQPNSICISCIWWEERRECFATSVDTIYLLEQLVALRFTVEEKNRIRRNLEGFRPLTVSKAKPDSEEFFKIIMCFPNPKPRNIEKDVKVFPWKILTHALKKIISKYSASYSSTAGALPTPRSSVYNGYQSDPGADRYTKPVSRSPSSSTASSAYSQVSPQYTEAPLSVSLPGLAQDYNVPSISSQYTSQDPASPPVRQLPPGYSEQTPVPGLSHLYTASPLSRRTLEGDDSTAAPYDSPRHAKRPRHTISGSNLYSLHDEAAASLEQMSRGFSEQSNIRVSLPSLAEAYTLPTSEPRYVTNEQSDFPLMPNFRRSSYDLLSFLDPSPAHADTNDMHAVGYRHETVQNAKAQLPVTESR